MVCERRSNRIVNPLEVCQTIAEKLNFAFQTMIYFANGWAAAGALDQAPFAAGFSRLNAYFFVYSYELASYARRERNCSSGLPVGRIRTECCPTDRSGSW